MTNPETKFKFDPDTHTYTLNGRRLRGVSSTLVKGGVKEPFAGPPTDYYLNRGTAVHLACELWDKGKLDGLTVTDDVRPYLDQWIDFRRNTGFDPVLIEHRIYHDGYFVAGTLDRMGMIDGRWFIIDIKTGQHARWHAIQLAAYTDILLRHMRREEKAGKKSVVDDLWHFPIRAVVRLDGKPGEKYNMRKYEDENDLVVWHACVTLANWKPTERR